MTAKTIMKHGKNYRTLAEKIDQDTLYTFVEAVALMQTKARAKFDESVEIHVRLNTNPKKNDEQVRATVILPEGTGRSKKVAVVTTTKEKEARDAGADIVGGEEVIADLKAGKIVPGVDFDALIATPEMMPKLAPVAKILGPKGMMPSPKTETVTPKIGETVEAMKKGKKVSFKNDDSANLHQSIGKLSFTAEQLKANFDIFVESVQKAKPENYKGKMVASMTVCSTMGPSLKLKI
jgi:large subunit ribosomal protein L1